MATTNPIEFGFFLDPNARDPEATQALARDLDRYGYDLIGIQDHPYQPAHFDAMALIGMILGQTERVRLFPDVANLPLRPPAMLAKTAASLDRLSGGRFELGLGAGAFWDAIRAMGGPVREPKEALKSLEEGIAVLRAWWSGNRGLRFKGDIYQLAGANPGPAPIHEIGIWLGVLKPKALALTGRLADGWIPSMSYVPPMAAKASNAAIDAAAIAAGRDPSAIRRIYNIGGSFAPMAPAPSTDNDTRIVGPPEHWVDALSHLATDTGFDTFILWSDTGERTLRTFIEEVAPAVRERTGRL